jgi:hypothetical protein
MKETVLIPSILFAFASISLGIVRPHEKRRANRQAAGDEDREKMEFGIDPDQCLT